MNNSEKDMLIKLIEKEIVAHPCYEDKLFDNGLRRAISIIEDIEADKE